MKLQELAALIIFSLPCMYVKMSTAHHKTLLGCFKNA